jgi:hypothetical protein
MTNSIRPRNRFTDAQQRRTFTDLRTADGRRAYLSARDAVYASEVVREIPA